MLEQGRYRGHGLNTAMRVPQNWSLEDEGSTNGGDPNMPRQPGGAHLRHRQGTLRRQGPSGDS